MMKIFKHPARLLPLVLIAVLFGGCATVQEIPIETAMTFEELQQKMNRAMDPTGRYARADTVIQRQIVSTAHWLDDPEEQLVEVKFERPDKFRLTTFEDNRPASAIIVNGSAGWLVDYKKQRIIELAGPALEQVQILSAIANPVSTLDKVFKSVDVKAVKIGAQEYYKLTCESRLKDQAPIEIYVGMDDYLTKRMKAVFNPGSTNVPYDSSIEGYSLYEGVMIPDKTTVRQDGVTQNTRVIFYKLDAPISPSEFKPPYFH